MKTRLKNIIYHKFELKYEIENNKIFTKVHEKNKNKKNKDQIKK